MKRMKINFEALIHAMEVSSGWQAKRLSSDTFKIHRKTITLRGRTIVINGKSYPHNGSATNVMKILKIDICKRGEYFYKLHLIQFGT